MGKSSWMYLSDISDRSHRFLRGHKSVLLTTLCLFCTLLCVFVTDRHLKLEIKVKSLETNLEQLEKLGGREEGTEQGLMRTSYLANQMSSKSDTHWVSNQGLGEGEGDPGNNKRVRRSSSPEEIRLSDTSCTCVGLPGSPGPSGSPGLPGSYGPRGEKEKILRRKSYLTTPLCF